MAAAGRRVGTFAEARGRPLPRLSGRPGPASGSSPPLPPAAQAGGDTSVPRGRADRDPDPDPDPDPEAVGAPSPGPGSAVLPGDVRTRRGKRSGAGPDAPPPTPTRLRGRPSSLGRRGSAWGPRGGSPRRRLRPVSQESPGDRGPDGGICAWGRPAAAPARGRRVPAGRGPGPEGPFLSQDRIPDGFAERAQEPEQGRLPPCKEPGAGLVPGPQAVTGAGGARRVAAAGALRASRRVRRRVALAPGAPATAKRPNSRGAPTARRTAGKTPPPPPRAAPTVLLRSRRCFLGSSTARIDRLRGVLRPTLIRAAQGRNRGAPPGEGQGRARGPGRLHSRPPRPLTSPRAFGAKTLNRARGAQKCGRGAPGRECGGTRPSSSSAIGGDAAAFHRFSFAERGPGSPRLRDGT